MKQVRIVSQSQILTKMAGKEVKKLVTIITSHKLYSCSNLYLDAELHLLPPGYVFTCTLNLADDVTVVLGHEVACEADHIH